MPFKRQQEQFSLAFIHAIASAAGFGIEEVRIDIDSVDLTIRQYGYDGIYPLCDSLRVQLKSTYANKPKNNVISFPLDIKNYNDLRQKTLVPRILMVVYTPEEAEKWLYQTEDSLVLYHSAYWIKIQGMSPKDNKRKVTVSIPLKQKVTVNELQRIMNLLAQGEKL